MKRALTVNSTILAVVLITSSAVHGATKTSSSTKHKYTTDVSKLAAAPAPAPGGILMVGSSVFRKWTNAPIDLAPLPVTNRGFGGSKTEDQLFFFDQIVPSSRASLVIWYCGSNDINANKTPDYILQNTKEWIGRTQAALPGARILIVSVMRAPQKREKGFLAQVDETNKGLRQLADSIPGVVYADVNPAVENSAGESVMECYVSDKLHPSLEGYRRMTSVLRPVIEKNWKPSAVSKSPSNP